MLSRYDVRTLPEDGTTLDDPLERAELEALFEGLSASTFGLAPTGDGHARIELRPVSGGATNRPSVRIRGHASAPIRVECVRCLAPIEQELRTELDLTLFPEPDEAERGSGSVPTDDRKTKAKVERIELSERELDEGYYRGFELDLPDLVREGLLLEVEMNPACADVSACDARVAALAGDSGNPAAETDAAEDLDPRWAPLRKFRLKSS